MMKGVPTVKKESLTRKFDFKKFIQKNYIYLFFFLVIVVFSFISARGGTTWFGRGHFLSSHNLISLVRICSPTIILASGFTFIMIAGYMDLSVGSAMSLCSVIYALVVRAGYPFIVGMLAAVAVGILCGLINGAIVTRLRITPVIATLVTMMAYKGVALLIVPDKFSGIKSTGTLSLPTWFGDYGRGRFLLGLPPAFYVAVVIIAIIVVLQRRTVIGKYSAAIGGNSVSAQLAGISVVKYVSILFVITGILAAFAGVTQASYSGMGDPLCGDGLETDCIIAVLLGGTAFTGGEGSSFKSVIGAMIIICITSGILTVVDAYYQDFLKGAVLILAVTMNKLINSKESLA
jgi:ribose/xylose/arabinose/galactoside ABC-type transport system permease subunit